MQNLTKNYVANASNMRRQRSVHIHCLKAAVQVCLFFLCASISACGESQKTSQAKPETSNLAQAGIESNHNNKTILVGSTSLSERDLVTGINLPWNLTWGPDDRIWVTERGGRVLRVDPESGSYTPVLEHPEVVDGAERGMFGLAHHPNWEQFPRVYIVYTIGDYKEGTARERLSMFTWNGKQLTDEKILLDLFATGWHNGSRVVVTSDNKLLMSTGEVGGNANTSQNLESLNGKILRLNLDGTIPDDNPYPDSYVYSFGHRNPQGLVIGRNNIIYSSEHGQALNDELNIIVPQGNYGWPFVEGFCDTENELDFCRENNIIEPILEWTPSMGVSGIAYYDHPAIPEWRNTILAAVLGGMGGEYKHMSVVRLSDDGTTATAREEFFAELNERIRDICVNPHSGAIYVALNGEAWPGQGPNVIKEYRNDAYAP